MLKVRDQKVGKTILQGLPDWWAVQTQPDVVNARIEVSTAMLHKCTKEYWPWPGLGAD